MPSVSRHIRRFSFFERLEIKLLRKYLQKRSQLHLSNYPVPMAVMAFDYIANEISIHGVYELDELETIFNALKGFEPQFLSGTACDIGANVGNHSRFFATRFGKVISFEPNPLILDLLKFNTRNYPNIVVSETALGNCEGSSRLSGDVSNLGNYSIVSPIDQPLSMNQLRNKQDFEVQITTLDSMKESLRNLQFIKLDVEGSEYQVLMGAAQSIREFTPFIAFEQWPSDFIDGKSKSIEYLAGLGYVLYWQKNYSLNQQKIFHKLIQFIQIISGFQVKYIETSDSVPPGHYSMLLAIHESKVSRFLSTKEIDL
jgi:FkbM family methyltransferase